MRANRALAAATAAAGSVLGFASLAYGCTLVTSPHVKAEPNQGQAATVTTVSGGNWAESTDVTLRWATVEGKVLTTIRAGSDGAFSARIIVPENAAAAEYYIVAVQKAVPSDTVRRAPFKVVAAGGATDPGGAGAGNVAGSTSGSTSGGTGSSTQGSQQQSDGTTSGGAVAGSGGLPTSPASSSSSSSSGALAAEQGQVDAAAAAPAPAVSPAVAERRQGSSVALGNPAPAPGLVPAAAADEDIAVPAASATGDVWGGFAEGPSHLAPSLVDLPDPVGSTSPAVVGAGLAVLALVGLAAGFAAAELRHRRVTVSEGSGR